jgi:hypothetical protein
VPPTHIPVDVIRQAAGANFSISLPLDDLVGEDYSYNWGDGWAVDDEYVMIVWVEVAHSRAEAPSLEWPRAAWTAVTSARSLNGVIIVNY